MVQADERRERRGRLKVFLGYASHVGKSVRMFNEGRRRKQRGQDVVVGAVQSEVGPELQCILDGLEIISTLTEKHGQASVAYLLGTPPIFPDRRSILHVRSLFSGYSLARISGKEVARIVRFYAMALVILALHGMGGWRLANRACLFCGPTALLLVLAAVLYGVSLVILSLRKRRRHEA